MDQTASGRVLLHADNRSDAEAGEQAVVAASLDAAFYLRRYGDVREARLDPAAHYCDAGWREGRDPAEWFDTSFYLRANPDIWAAAVNPFWHFLVQGCHEGRLPQPQGRIWRRELETALPPAQRPAYWSVRDDAPPLSAAALGGHVQAACCGARGLVVALSHDRYIEVPGGTQLLIADEQRKFNGDGAVYLHLSPVAARLGLAPPQDGPIWLNVILDGAMLGIATAEDAAEALSALPGPVRRLLVVHNLHGQQPETVVSLAAALRPSRSIFWVHDFGAGCGSPRLLRNDIAFCGAPPAASMACRICVYGSERAVHLARVDALFRGVAFDLVAPSAIALDLWQRAAPVPVASVSVHGHAALLPCPDSTPPVTLDRSPARVAFVGYPAFHKGWGVFRELALAARDLGNYQFFHFASADALLAHDGLTSVAAETSPAQPFGMVRALVAWRIDLVLALSPWPETFGYVPLEAIAAGADVVTTEASGNAAAEVRAAGRGVVLADDAAVLDWFLHGAAARHAMARRRDPMAPLMLRHGGSAATLAFDGAPVSTTDPDLHLLLDGVRIDGKRALNRWRFRLPRTSSESRTLRLRSRHFQPVWDTLHGADTRRLGVAVTSLRLNGKRVAADDARRRAAGWHPPESGWQWTNGDAKLCVGRAQRLDVGLLPLGTYWQAPLLAP